MSIQAVKHFFRSGIRAMPPRDPHQIHRVSTPLELLFDLVVVIAIAAAAAELHHALAHAHVLAGVGKFMLAFFAIWWAWMNYTWFVSAYDNDDALFRLLTMLVMAGALTMAAGIQQFFQHNQLNFIVIGFVVMRIAMVLFWLRATKHHPALKRTTLTYAAGIFLVQLYWLALLGAQPLTPAALYGLFALGALLELTVPAVAERQGITPWHHHHMMERYGLLNIIVLGETLLASMMAFRSLADSTEQRLSLLQLPLLAIVLLFCLWWLYFSREEHLQQHNLRMALTWGYGHFIIYAAGAAVGAGVAVNIDLLLGQAELSAALATATVTLPISLYLAGLWLVRDRFIFIGFGKYTLLLFALLIPLAGQLAGLASAVFLLVLSVFIRSSKACCSTH